MKVTIVGIEKKTVQVIQAAFSEFAEYDNYMNMLEITHVTSIEHEDKSDIGYNDIYITFDGHKVHFEHDAYIYMEVRS